MHALFRVPISPVERSCVAAIGVVHFSVRGFGCALFILRRKREHENEEDVGVLTIDIVDINEDGKITVLETIRYKRLLCGSSSRL